MRFFVFSTLTVCCFWVASNAQSDPSIVIDRDPTTVVNPAQPVVESGSSVIIGEPQENIKAAYRSWKSACEAWKSELKSLNKRNLMIASCGSPKKRVEKVNVSSYFIYESKSTYKIKVGCK